MEAEHCRLTGHDYEFETSNYKIKTYPQKEWNIVRRQQNPDPSEMGHGRRIPNVEELLELPDSRAANLLLIEVIMLTLYTGPMVGSMHFGLF